MKPPTKTIFSFVLILAGIAVGIMLPRPHDLGQPTPLQRHESSDVPRLFSLGLQPNIEQEQAEFLTQLSLQHQESDPSLVPHLWIRYHDYLDKQNLSVEDYLLRLEVFLESVDKSVLVCNTESSFASVWKVREQIVEQRQAKVGSLISSLNEKLDVLIKDVQAMKKDGKPLEAIALVSERGEPIIVTIRAVKNAWATDRQATSALEKKIRALVTEVLSVASGQVAELGNERDAEAKKDSSGNTPENASDTVADAKGAYEVLADRLTQLHSTLDEADLPAWLGFFGEEKVVTTDNGGKSKGRRVANSSEESLANIQKEIERLLADIGRLQGLRYNLWALKIIYRAQQSSNWDGLLGRIDVGLLQPTVTALYSTTYDSLIREKTDPRTRLVAVQTILNGKKARLASF